MSRQNVILQKHVVGHNSVNILSVSNKKKS